MGKWKLIVNGWCSGYLSFDPTVQVKQLLLLLLPQHRESMPRQYILLVPNRFSGFRFLVISFFFVLFCSVLCFVVVCFVLFCFCILCLFLFCSVLFCCFSSFFSLQRLFNCPGFLLHQAFSSGKINMALASFFCAILGMHSLPRLLQSIEPRIDQRFFELSFPFFVFFFAATGSR